MSLAIVRVGPIAQEDSGTEVMKNVEDVVEGDWASLEQLPALTDWLLVRKVSIRIYSSLEESNLEQRQVL